METGFTAMIFVIVKCNDRSLWAIAEVRNVSVSA